MIVCLSSLLTHGLRGCHSVAAVSVAIASSLLGVKQVILHPVSLGPLSGQPWGHDGSGS